MSTRSVRSCAATLAGAILNAMITSAMRTVRACLQISTAAAAILLFAFGSIAHSAPLAGSITYVGTDSNIYYCDTKCATPKCITCKAAAIHVRRDEGILPVAPVDTVPGAGPATAATEYGWRAF